MSKLNGETKHNKSDHLAEGIEDDCRLSILSSDVLGKIFEALSAGELINLSTVSPTVKNAIGEQVVQKRLINFGDWNRVCDTDTMFKDFGVWFKFMTIGKVNIRPETRKNETAFDFFLSLLVKHCAKNRLETLSLHFDIGQINSDLLNAAMPFFTNLRKFHYLSVGRQESYGHGQLFATIIDAATRLESIQLENTSSKGTWLQHPNMQNIQNVALINSSISDEKSWDTYFDRKPAIKTFAWINVSTPNDVLCSKVIHNCPNLEQLIDVQHLVPEEGQRKTFSMNRYGYVSAAKNLRCARVTAYTPSGQDLIHFFGAIAQTNTIENLSIHFLLNAMGEFNYEANHLDIFNNYTEFTSLKRLEIQNNSSCMFWNKMLVSFMTDLVNLNEVNIASAKPINPVQLTRIVMAPRNLTILKIHNANIVYLGMAMDTIGKIRGNKEAITVMINAQQHMELKGREISQSVKIIVV